MPRDRPKLCYRSSRDDKGDLEPKSPVQDRLDVSYPDFEGLERNGRTRTCLWHSSAMSPPCSSTTDTFDCSNSIASIWCRRQWKRQKGRLTRLLSRSQRTHFYCWIEIVTSWSHRCKGHPSTTFSVANCFYVLRISMLRKICGTLRMISLMSHIFVNQRIVGNTDTKGTIIGNLKASPLPKKKS